jgi:hypothetical protein
VGKGLDERTVFVLTDVQRAKRSLIGRSEASPLAIEMDRAVLALVTAVPLRGIKLAERKRPLREIGWRLGVGSGWIRVLKT